MIITRLLAPQTPERVVKEVMEHVKAELSASADADDDPTTLADEVIVYAYPVAPGAVDSVTSEVFESACIVVRGTLEREPNAPYLKDDYDPAAGVPDRLLLEAYNDDEEAMP